MTTTRWAWVSVVAVVLAACLAPAGARAQAPARETVHPTSSSSWPMTSATTRSAFTASRRSGHRHRPPRAGGRPPDGPLFGQPRVRPVTVGAPDRPAHRPHVHPRQRRNGLPRRCLARPVARRPAAAPGRHRHPGVDAQEGGTPPPRWASGGSAAPAARAPPTISASTCSTGSCASGLPTIMTRPTSGATSTKVALDNPGIHPHEKFPAGKDPNDPAVRRPLHREAVRAGPHGRGGAGLRPREPVAAVLPVLRADGSARVAPGA